MRAILFLIIILLFPISGHSSSPWQRKVINFERNQYKAGFQNWMITQSEKGWIYCANSKGLLEFDGVNWSLYNVKNEAVRSLKVFQERIYIGGSSEFGYFESNNIGLLSYKSLSIKTKDWGGEVWNILADDKNIYFISDGHIHIYNVKNESLVTISANRKIDSSNMFGDKLYIGSSDGIFYLNNNNTFTFLSTSEQLKGYKLVSMLPYNEKILVTTARSGLYIIEDKKISKIQSKADDFIKNNQLFSTSIIGSKVALGSVQNGVFLFDIENASYKETFNLSNGLKNNTVLSSFFDKDENLWLGLDKGISYINLNSPIRPLFATISPIGTGYCSALYNNTLYLGTNQGLYKMTKDGSCQLVAGTEGQIWSMSVIDNSLFCSGDNGITVISATETYKIALTGTWEIQPLKEDTNKLIVGTYFNFFILEKKNNKWSFSHKVADFYESTKGFIQDDENYTFWMINLNREIQKVTFDKDFKKVVSQKKYTSKHAYSSSSRSFKKIDNNIVICSHDGIYQYSRITDSFDHYSQLESMLEGPKYYEYLFVDKLKNIWFIANNQLKFLPYSSEGYKTKIFNWGISDELMGSFENISIIDSTSAIVTVDNAFIKIDLSQRKDTSYSINTHIRKFICSKNDSIISYGKTAEQIELPYSLNSVNIHFAATDFSRSSEILYSYKLQDIDKEWSMPSSKTSKEYTNLPDGKYIFEVKAILNGDTCSDIASIEFTILSPWYRSILAYIIYLSLTALLFIILYKKTISKQKKIIHQKGEELIAQNRRHEEENKIKDQEIYELHNENLKAELRYKTQELTGYILNAIRKNEILEDVKKNAINISRAIDEQKQLNIIKQKVVRLISQIDNSIEHDNEFEVFKSNFDLVHKDFFKLLDKNFPGLSRNDKILCAYLNMNLSTKEIAPLLNISVRGVEVNRYRLRKKMNLDRDINLSEYLQNLK